MIHTILEIYAILCAVGMPVGVYILLKSNKKDGLIGRYLALIDKAAGFGPAEEIKSDEMVSGEQKHAEEIIKNGITPLVMSIGDEYFCRLNSINRENVTTGIEWSSEDEFVGSIINENTFKAEKAGTVQILSRRKNDAFDTGAIIYEINVRPSNPAWCGEKLMENVMLRRKIIDVLPMMSNYKLAAENPKNGVFIFQNASRRVALQFDALKELVRGTITFRSENADFCDELYGGLAERFDSLKTSSLKDISFWVHQKINAKIEELDAYAFVRRNSRNEMVLGIGRNWREYGDTEEFLRNIAVAEKIFTGCLEGLDVIPVSIDLQDTGLRNDEITRRLMLQDSEKETPAVPADVLSFEPEETPEDPISRAVLEEPSKTGSTEPVESIDLKDVPDIDKFTPEETPDEKENDGAGDLDPNPVAEMSLDDFEDMNEI